MSKRNVPESLKKRIAGKQFYKCANEPDSNLYGLSGYECPLWKNKGKNHGSFDESGYDIDHINEFCISKDDNEDNLQALCKCCHSVKTKRFMANRIIPNKKMNHKKNCECDYCCLLSEDDDFMFILNIFVNILCLTNFNPETPQYHNMYLLDINTDQACIYTNNEWKKQNINIVLSELIDRTRDSLLESSNNANDIINKKKIYHLKKELNNLKLNNFNYCDKMCKYLKYVLFCKKDIVIATRKLSETQNKNNKKIVVV